MIVSNSSVLIALSVIGQLPILQKMWTRVCVPSAVWEEVVVTGKGEPGASTVENAGWIVVQEVQNTLLAHALQESLDRGEAEAIVLALEQHSSIILLDEKPARERATYFGLRPMGTPGVLIWGAQNGYIPQLKPILNTLMNEGDFRLSNALYRRALKEVGE